MIYSMTEIEARYQETDKMGVIYHGNYATWFEVARTDYIRKLGFSYADMEKKVSSHPSWIYKFNIRNPFLSEKLK